MRMPTNLVRRMWKGGGRRRRAILNGCLSVATSWFITELLAAMAFSFGFCFVKLAPLGVRAERDWVDALDWMDGRSYAQIATNGYDYDPAVRSGVAFYPVYPLLGRGVVKLTTLRPETALVLISNLSLLATMAMLFCYVRARFPEAPRRLADFSVLTVALAPTGCFFRLAYSESTFMFLVVVAMYAMLRRWPLWTIALIVGLAGATRPVGVALLAPFAVHLYKVDTRRRSADVNREVEVMRGPMTTRRAIELTIRANSGPSEISQSTWRSMLARCHLGLYLILACWGLAGFLAYQAWEFGDPFATVKTQIHWHVREPVRSGEKVMALLLLEPLRSVYDPSSDAFWAERDAYGLPWFSLQFANPLYFLAAIALSAIGAWRKWLNLEEVLLAALMLLIPYVTRGYEMGMGSMGRFAAVVFPIWIVLARIITWMPGTVRAGLFAMCGVYLSLYIALYAACYFIF